MTNTILFLLLAGATMGQAQGPQSLSGTISDTMCGAGKHMMPGGTAKCIRDCVKDGDKYALVVGDKVYVLNGHSTEIDKLAGKKAVIKGKVVGDTVMVSSVLPGK